MIAAAKARGAAKFTTLVQTGADARGAIAFTDQRYTCVDSGWREIIAQIHSFYGLQDDWDGNESVAPAHELVDAAVRLAYLLQQASHPAPDRVVAGVNGTITFEYPDTPFTEIEIISVDEASVYENGRREKVIAF